MENLCTVEGCSSLIKYRGMCNKHYRRMRKYGTPLAYSIHDPSEILDREDGTHLIILRTKSGKHNGSVVVDSSSVDKLRQYKWCLSSKKYAVTYIREYGKRESRISMHQMLLPVEKGFWVDHIDRNKLNNRLENLRRVSYSQNRINCNLRRDSNSGVTGVSYDKMLNRWRAHIGINGEKHKLGTYVDKDGAVRARLTAEVEYFGEFAPQKNLYEEYGIRA